ncbi:MAG: TonB-dependent receptor [Acidobacteria bacterium]|nr:TonB-dependent receptor [Acidobacteriota bacterium]
MKNYWDYLAQRSFVVLVLVVLLPAFVLGQAITGTLVGTVRDSSAAVVAGAKVKVTNQNTGISYEQTSNEAGHYAFPYLPPGTYRVSVEFAGFRTALSIGNTVKVNETTRVDFRLAVGEITETIEVSSDALQLQTETSSVQNVIEERVIQTVPNINHNPFYYASLQPGVVPRASFNLTQGQNSFGIGIDGRRTFSALSINGGQAFTNDILVDGVSTQGSAWNEAAVVPNQEGIQEVRTIINNFSAEYGRAQGVISVATKSGSNELHGSVFDRLRNEALNANTFGSNARGIPRGPFKLNSFGASVGGPLIKDKAFFFVSYEGLRHNRSLDYFKTVPTDLEKAGNFSQTFANVNGVPTPIQIYHPFNVRQVEANLYQRALIPNAVIPNPDPFALKLMSFYPQPNRTPDPDICGGCFNINNYFLRVIQRFRRNSLNTRLDYRLGKHSLYGTFGISDGTIGTPRSWGQDNPFYSRSSFIGNVLSDNNPYGSIGYIGALTPSFALEVRYGVTRINANNEADVFPDFNYSQFGISNELQALNAIPGAPPDFEPGSGLSALNQTGSLHKRERQTNHALTGSGTKTYKRWNFKFGAESRVYLANYTDAQRNFLISTSSGFSREFVTATGGGAGPPITGEAAGWGPASFLLGAGHVFVPSGFGVKLALAQKYFGLFTQNDWRATDRLTINLGLRWDLQPGPTERYNRMSSFDFSRPNPFGMPGAFFFPGNTQESRNLWDTKYGDFGPRVGLAYQPYENMVIRAGYGITYLPTNTGYFDGPFTYGADTFISGFTDNQPFGLNPAGVLIGPYHSAQVNRIVRGTGADPRAPGLYGGGLPRFDRQNYDNGRVQQWSLFVERKAGPNWLFSAGYAASKGDHLPYARVPLNSTQFLPRALLDSFRAGYVASNGRNNPANTQVPNPFQTAGGPLIPFTGSVGRATMSQLEVNLPYPHFGGMQLQRSIGYSRYHAFQLQVNRRFAQGLLLNAHYTWSKSLDFGLTEAQTNGFGDTGGYDSNIDQLNYRNNYKLSLTDTPHRFVASFVYELPFGPGKAVALANPVLKGILSGWRLGGVGVLESGYPIQISGGSNSLDNRADRIPGVPAEVPKASQRWYDGRTDVTLPSGRVIRPCAFCFLKYNPDAFSARVVTTPDGSIVPDVYWFGNAALTFNDIRGAGLNNWNLSIERTFRARERLSIELAAQFSNAFNHTLFTRSINSGLGGTLGSVDAARSPQLNLTPGQLSNQNFGTRGQSTFDLRQVELHLRVRF